MPDITRRKVALAGLVLGCALLTKVAPAAADGGPKAEVLVIHATKCDKHQIDPEAADAPAMGFDCIKVLDHKSLALKQGTPATMSLPNGRTFQVAFNGMDKARYKVTASISKPDGSGFNALADIAAEPNKKFHVGGLSYQGGVLMLAIKIVP
jgi:hypothetical protein